MRTAMALITLLLLTGCGANGSTGANVASTPLEHSTEPHSTYAAPTLPPAYTPTATITRTPRPTITSTPFTIVTIEPSAPAETESTPSPTSVSAFGPWERVEDAFLNVSVEIPPGTAAVRSGRSLLIRAAEGESSLALEIEVRVDSPIASRFPQGVDLASPLSILDGMLREMEANRTILNVIRPSTELSLGGNPGASAAIRTRPPGEEESDITLWYLAAIVYSDKAVVRFQASAPESSGVTNLSLAERVAKSIQFIE